MKIVFICSSLEPGRDGVGDYTRRLAAELIRQGNECRILSLNDKSDHAPVENRTVAAGFKELQQSEGTDVICLRLPKSLSWPERVELARQWVEEFKPDWVSLQFVPFGFHLKGLCFGLGKHLTTINSKAPWQIMFHELWLGLGEGSSVKHRAWGAIQKWIIKDMINRLRPQVLHTQAEPYRIVLSKLGIKASLLPLFGNIPLIPGDGWTGLLEPLITQVLERPQDRAGIYLAGVFGGVHPEWNAEQTVNTVLPLVQRSQKILLLVFFGKNQIAPAVFNHLRQTFKKRAVLVEIGERTAEEISKILQSLDLGLATSPGRLIQKSSSVAAMLEHGLPVLVTRDDWQLRRTKVGHESPLQGLLSPEQFAGLEMLPTRNSKPSGASDVRRVAGQMLEAMACR